jgi:hypothetical protein
VIEVKAGKELLPLNVAWDADRFVTSSPKGKKEKKKK